jgi:hypothetical protein
MIAPLCGVFWSHVKYAKRRVSHSNFLAIRRDRLSGSDSGNLGILRWLRRGGASIRKINHSPVSRFRYSHSCDSRSAHRFGNWRRGRHRGLAFFIEERKRHYEQINDKMLKQLRDIRLEKSSFRPVGLLKEYRYSVSLPDSRSIFYAKAYLHIRRDDASAAEALRLLPYLLKGHDERVSSVEDKLIKRVQDELTSHQITYDKMENLWENLIHRLFGFWLSNIDLIKLGSQARLMERFESRFRFTYDPTYEQLYVDMDGSGTPIWRGVEQESSNVVNSIRNTVADPAILTAFIELLGSKSAVEEHVNRVREVAAEISELIEGGDYTTVAECCPTIPKLIWSYLIGPSLKW